MELTCTCKAMKVETINACIASSLQELLAASLILANERFIPLGQFGVEEGTFGSTVTVGRRAGGRGRARGGHSLEGCGGSGGDACAMVFSKWVCSGTVSRGLENVWDCGMFGGAGNVGLLGLGGSGWLVGGVRGRCRLFWGWHGQ